MSNQHFIEKQPDTLLDVKQTASYIGVSTKTVRRHLIANREKINNVLGYQAITLQIEGKVHKYYIDKGAIDFINSLDNQPTIRQSKKQPLSNLLYKALEENKRLTDIIIELNDKYQILLKTLHREREQGYFLQSAS